MCCHYDPSVPGQCREDDAEDVFEKERLNFCDWFGPSEDAFNPAHKAEADQARQALDALFGDAEAFDGPQGADADEAEKLFK